MANPQAGETKKRVIVQLNQNDDSGKKLIVAGIAAVVSIAAHAGLIVLLIFLPAGDARGDDSPQGELKSPTKVDEEKEKEPDLTNTDIGIDSETQTNFNNDRIEEISVPGIVDKNEAPGIIGAPEGPPKTVPAPPGTGAGTGGALFASDTGTLGGFGTPGGMGGLMANPFAGRSASTRKQMVEEGGGNALSEAAVARGLKFLAMHQAPDGHWSLHEFNRHARREIRTKDPMTGKERVTGYEYYTDRCQPGTNRNDDIAGTAFGLLPFLAAGITHQPPTDKKTVEDYSKNVKAGLDYLKKHQGQDGYFGGGMYSHAIATIAMCEAYGLTSDPTLKSHAQAAMKYTEAGQDPNGGGWRYQPKQPGDMSVTGWHVMALKSGQMSGLTVKQEVLKKVEKYLDASETSVDTGMYCYVGNQNPSPAMTSVGLLCRQYSGINPRNPGLQAGVAWLNKNAPPATQNIYYQYYATQVMHHMGGDSWKQWNLGPDGTGKGGIRDTLLSREYQDPKIPEMQGSWMLAGEHGGGRIMSTSLALLTLEVYYRHLPLYRRDMGIMKDAK
jgi:hypothetical protein